MLLYAGTMIKYYLIYFNYYCLNTKVTILKWIIESAGIKNKEVISKFNTSETKCNKISSIIKIDNILKETIRQIKPIKNDDFGYYLAGLIDGDGHFSKAEQLIIVFYISDVSLAYYIKKKLKHGIVKKVKNKKAVIFLISSKIGFELFY